MTDFDRDDRVAEWLDAAARLWAATRYCWLATTDASGEAHLRPMGRTPPVRGDEAWRLRFIADGRTRKVADIARNAALSITAQRDADDAYLALRGKGEIGLGARRDARLWRDAYDAYFPGEDDREHAAFLEVRVDRIDLWMRSVTPEPFGLRAVTLTRDDAEVWRRIA
jgi:general stress protein 26